MCVYNVTYMREPHALKIACNELLMNNAIELVCQRGHFSLNTPNESAIIQNRVLMLCLIFHIVIGVQRTAAPFISNLNNHFVYWPSHA